MSHRKHIFKIEFKVCGWVTTKLPRFSSKMCKIKFIRWKIPVQYEEKVKKKKNYIKYEDLTIEFG